MQTPICDFVRRYAAADPLRLHMPGHKGLPLLGPEPLDITEIDGADVLYHASGVIRESERNAAALFGAAETLYSTEGSSLCIRAMLYLAALHAGQPDRPVRIVAGRNAHRAFLSAAALLDLDVIWLRPGPSLLRCPVDPAELEQTLRDRRPAAVYLTSPDYLGNCLPLAPLAELCHRYGALLLVDNAHGSYLNFLGTHPLAQGADLCCDSAHKTLPVLTGGAYLHLSQSAPDALCALAPQAMALFASTSPSYLILQSLDAANRYLATGYAEKLAAFVPAVDALKARLVRRGYALAGTEPLKLTICAKPYGYTGAELAARLAAQHIVCEYADADFTVLMLTPEPGGTALTRLEQALCAIERRAPILIPPPHLPAPVRVLTPRQALFAPRERVRAADSVGRILADAAVSCPPAVCAVACGERIDENAAACFAYYGIETCWVVRE